MSLGDGNAPPDEALIARRERARSILREATTPIRRRELWSLVRLSDALNSQGDLSSEAEYLIVKALVRLDEAG